MTLSLPQFEKISTVMYEPLQYIHPDYKTVAILNDERIWQQFANHQLIKEYQLITEIDCDIESDLVVEKLFTQWSLLPQCALFLGYFYSPKYILHSGDYYELSSSLQAFLSLRPVMLINEENKNDNNEIEPITLGYQLLFTFIHSISVALAQRFKLCFPINQSPLELSPSLRLSRSLFLLVLNYAAFSA
ncbi:type III secretion protein [Proteus faecis]|uniref:Type III secretion protein n=1 Tax=Proteus faecis TaxID=2050967 RepID=A0ABZ3EKR4_9GAMM|nr:type III secretion protein [Proteus faecis]MCT8250300.1 type III secretion protein [Proteus faecis]MDM3869187.1 type III secretion protein [Proteus faecis]